MGSGRDALEGTLNRAAEENYDPKSRKKVREEGRGDAKRCPKTRHQQSSRRRWVGDVPAQGKAPLQREQPPLVKHAAGVWESDGNWPRRVLGCGSEAKTWRMRCQMASGKRRRRSSRQRRGAPRKEGKSPVVMHAAGVWEATSCSDVIRLSFLRALQLKGNKCSLRVWSSSPPPAPLDNVDFTKKAARGSFQDLLQELGCHGIGQNG